MITQISDILESRNDTTASEIASIDIDSYITLDHNGNGYLALINNNKMIVIESIPESGDLTEIANRLPCELIPTVIANNLAYLSSVISEARHKHLSERKNRAARYLKNN